MKKQKFYHITMYYENFGWNLARNVLAEWLRWRFALDFPYMKRQPTDKETAERMAEVYPNVKNIKVFQLPKPKNSMRTRIAIMEPQYIESYVITGIWDITYYSKGNPLKDKTQKYPRS